MRLASGDRASVERTQTMMERQLHHLIRLVDDLLDVSRISQGKFATPPGAAVAVGSDRGNTRRVSSGG